MCASACTPPLLRRKKFQLPNGTGLAVSAGLQHIGGAVGWGGAPVGSESASTLGQHGPASMDAQRLSLLTGTLSPAPQQVTGTCPAAPCAASSSRSWRRSSTSAPAAAAMWWVDRPAALPRCCCWGAWLQHSLRLPRHCRPECLTPQCLPLAASPACAACRCLRGTASTSSSGCPSHGAGWAFRTLDSSWR